MTTPIYDFTRKYADSHAIRLHMPGHKGIGVLGCESLDITEIAGADELFDPTGIIAESEANASKCFDCHTVYSTEGSSLCIRAMLLLAMQVAAAQGRKPVIAAARNVHKTFLTAAALLDFDVCWLPQEGHYLTAAITRPQLEDLLHGEDMPTALYLTTPDYLGHQSDIRMAADFCHAHNMLLLIDNAHGAYLHFLQPSQHPIALGADLCCDSAHKTLPVLTGGAYLHICDAAPALCHANCKMALSVFATTSPSYLILASLDLCNQQLASTYPARLTETIAQLTACRKRLQENGWSLIGDEPMKLTIAPKCFGYTGIALAALLQRDNIHVEFADRDYVVLMPSTETPTEALQRLSERLLSIPRLTPLSDMPPSLGAPVPVLRPHDVLLAPTESLPIAQCEGRICGTLSISCPPAVPIVMCGERITAAAVRCMRYYGIETCLVLKENPLYRR